MGSTLIPKSTDVQPRPTVSESNMMESLHVAVAVFSLLSLGQTAPTTNCESLTQRIQISGRDKLLGRWYGIGESMDIRGANRLLEVSKGNVWVNYTAATEENIMIGSLYLKGFGHCFSMTFNSTFVNNTFTSGFPPFITGFPLKTGCPDCIVTYSNVTIGSSSYKGVQLLSRRPKISAAELEEFKKQVTCLNLPEAAILDPDQGFCPDSSLSKDSKSFDTEKVSDEISRNPATAFSEVLSQLSSILVGAVEN